MALFLIDRRNKRCRKNNATALVSNERYIRTLQKITVDTDALFSPVDLFESDDIAFHASALLSYLPLTVQSLTSKCILIFEPQLDESVAITLDTHPTSFAAEDVAFPSPFPNLNEYIQLSSNAATITGAQMLRRISLTKLPPPR